MLFKLKTNALLFLFLLGVLSTITTAQANEETNGDTAKYISKLIRQYSKNHNDTHRINLKNLFDEKSKSLLRNVDALRLVQAFVKDGEGLEKLKVSMPCVAAIYQLFGPILNMTKFDPAAILALLGQPVGKVLDAWGKPPSRILLINTHWVGAYDECSSIDNMKYCRSNMYFAMQFQYPGTYGMCFPAQCTAAEINSFLPAMNKVLQGIVILAPDSVVCDEPNQYHIGNYLTIILCGFLLFLICIGTYTEMLSDSLKNLVAKEDSVKVDDAEGLVRFQADEEGDKKDIAEVPSARMFNHTKDIIDRSGLYSFAVSFSLIRNTKAILSTDAPRGAINSINGIRAISMFWVILGHIYFFGVTAFGKIDNTLALLDVLHRFTFMAISNAFVSVDTFFLLSGLLVAYLTFRRMDKANGYPLKMVFLGYLHRYIRLTPSLIFVMLFFNNVMPLLLNGPFALNDLKKGMMESCDKYWWTNVLYINNFYSMGLQCIGWVWYLANDMQFFILSPGILYAMFVLDRRFSTTRWRYVLPGFVIGGLCIASMVVSAVLMAEYDLPAVQMAIGNPKGVRGGEFGDYVYEKPYTRATPYLVGLYLGYILHRRVKMRFNLRSLIVFIGWVVAIVTGLSVVYGTWNSFKINPVYFTDAEDVIYESLHRFAWGIAVAWVIYACQNQAGGFIDSFLSWKFWIPMSRLTYGAYLTHPLVLFFFYWTRETVFHYEDNTFVFNIISCTVISYVTSFILAITVEYPVLNLEKKLLG